MGGLDGQIEEAIDFFEEVPLEAIRDVVEAAYDNIVSRSPVLTGYYMTNHRIMIKDSSGRFKTAGTPKLVPVNKPGSAVALQFVSNLSATEAEEKAKLSRVGLGDIITISTSVPYAFAIETNTMVYANAETQFRVTK